LTIDTNFQALEPENIPLTGINLIEASAGTGKTYTITTLIIRLLIEERLQIKQILVVTFTKAATEELRDRVRRRLREVLQAFQGQENNDPLIQYWLQRFEAERHEIVKHLILALRGFDEAAIYTIHSFCQRMLRDNAFESGTLFDTELLTDTDGFIREVVEDFWRQHFYHASPLFLDYVFNIVKWDSPEKLQKSLGGSQFIEQLLLTVIPEQRYETIDTYVTQAQQKEQDFIHISKEVQKLLNAYGVEFIEALREAHKNKKFKRYYATTAEKCFTELQKLKQPQLVFPENVSNFLKKYKTELITLFAPLAELNTVYLKLEQLHSITKNTNDFFETYIRFLRLKLFFIAREKLLQKKQQHNVQSFNDFLGNLYHALHDATHGQTLATRISHHYRAALIDEFQDTDPIQYAIFSRIYYQNTDRLFLIGDPKQAIYSFRGADIFAYMEASRNAHRRYTLDINWRSEAGLIHATNALFSAHDNPFLLGDIHYHDVSPPPNHEARPHLTITGEASPPLHYWLVNNPNPTGKADKPLSKKFAKPRIYDALVGEIYRLLVLGQQGKALIGDKPVQAGDIAILVQTNDQAIEIQKILQKSFLPSVLYSQQSVFDSREAEELHRVLLAIAEPHNERFLKTALTSSLFSVSGNQLYHLVENDREWQKKIKDIHYYHTLWQKLGFIQMFRTLLTREKVQQRLLQYADGERRLTNVLHLGEQLQNATNQKKLGMQGLLKWFDGQRHHLISAAGEEESDEQQLRLESDDKRIKIITIHKSKGLEYPIVFYPHSWNAQQTRAASKEQAQPISYHNEQHELVLDFDPSDENSDKQKLERLAESMRLLYVALTRAKHRCYLICGNIKDFPKTALYYLLFHKEPNNIDEKITITDEDILERLTALQSKVPNDMLVTPMPEPSLSVFEQQQDRQQLSVRDFSHNIIKNWRVSSFSALSATHSDTDAIERPDYDAHSYHDKTAMYTSISAEEEHIFNFPRGAQAGTCLHTLFEYLDFQNTERHETIITETLNRHGYDAEKWQTTIQQLITDVLNTPLTAQRQDFTLAAISRKNRIDELEFFYPLALINSEALRDVVEAHLPLNQPDITLYLEQLNFSPVQGLMKGFIDMVFEFEGKYYLVDYKSNLLGMHMHAYHHDQLSIIMRREFYTLQYYIYMVALHRYLSTRVMDYDYNTHIGGVYYLFLRGMKPNWGAHYGVYYDLPDKALIEALSHYLTGDENNAPVPTF